MQVINRPASRGLTWLTAGIRIMGRQPVALLMLTFIQFLLIMLPAVAFPIIGPGITAAMIPVMYLGLMNAIRATERGEVPNPMMLFTAFQAESNGVWKRLMLLGLISGACTLAIFYLAQIFWPMPDMSGISEQTSPTEVMELGMRRVWPTLLAAFLSIPVQMAFWYAPMFVGWHKLSIGKAAFFSAMAVWRNFGAFAMLFLGWFGVILALNILLTIVISVLGIPVSLLTVILSPILLAVFAAAYCSFWVSYRDVVEQS